MGLTDPAVIEQAYAEFEAAQTRLASLDYTGLDVRTLLELQSRRETLKCAAEAVDHQILAAAQTQATAKDIGAKDWVEVLHIRLRISWEEARRRVRDGDHLGPRSAITGEPLGPVWELIAAALAEGAINTEHVAVITNFFAKVPLWVDPATLAQCEADLEAAARYQTPEDLRRAAADLLYRLDQDGPEPDDSEPDPKRAIRTGKQKSDGTSEVSGTIDAETRAYWDAINDKWAAPGMCNPADPVPCLSGTPTQEQIDNDTRTLAQRQHDAYRMIGRMALTSGMLGEHNGFPVAVIATCTVTDLHKRTGTALTHTGTNLPVKDLVQMAATTGADHYLAVFDDHTEQPLYLGRARRTATVAQRFALFARDRGCTKPHCTAPASRCQAHHVNTNWRDDGPTDITNLTLACGPHNRLADTGGWTTTMKNGRTHWTPPPLLDVGQPRTNHYHHPTLYPTETGDNNDGETDSPAS
ncbi:HNH endonuclease signature motif containing protein [Mycolicibacterium sp. CBMA 226]|uniref:HNH endonuclease signature motif containing protein n=1 Tax=Mycolicibacterium sp. CBMA 226 TaxID=2606611 RepID=UPI0012DD8E0C|nr:HNH endonuclease signature motif containing protein [Mycolicibacterium sp. CBMA 226]MUL78289.1 DUF222 domain-containing protein [Mycolicibacterium sp. CBMA 226]